MTTWVIENATGTDIGLPVMNGTAGSRLAVLRHCLVTVAGWTEIYTAGNVAWFRPSVVTGNRFPLRVSDDAAQDCRLVGYVQHNAGTDTGIGPFPTDTQVSGGLWLRGSSSADTTGRPWLCVVWDRGFRIIVWHKGAVTDAGSFLFTDLLDTRVPGDAYATIIKGNIGTYINNTSQPASRTSGLYIAGPYTQGNVSTAVAFSYMPMSAETSDWFSTDSGYTGYPDPFNGVPVVWPVYVLEQKTVRGRVPGHWGHSYSHDLPATLPAGTVPDRTLIARKGYWGTISTYMIVESSDWGGSL
jgi:hypothetical protein